MRQSQLNSGLKKGIRSKAVPYFKVNDHCNGCLACVENCPANALNVRVDGNKQTLLHNMAKCARCATCWRICPQEAIEFQYLLESRWNEVITLNIVRCSICGEILHTDQLKATLNEKQASFADPLCPRHRATHASLHQAYSFRRTNSNKRGKSHDRR